MKRLRRLFFGLFKVFALASLLVVLGVTTVFFFPGLVIQDATLPWLGRALRAYEVSVNWKEGHWSARSTSFWVKELRVQLVAPCYSTAKPYSRSCFSSVDAAISIDLKSKAFAVAWLRIPKGDVRIEALTADKSEPLTPTPSPLRFVDELRTTWLPRFKWKDISVQNTKILWSASTGTLRAAFSAEGRQDGENRDLHVKAEGTYAQRGKRTPLEIDVRLLTSTQPEMRYEISGYWGTKKDRYQAKTQGLITTSHIKGNLAMERLPFLDALPWLTLEACHYEWREDKGGESHLRMNCPVVSGEKSHAEIQGDLKVEPTGDPVLTVESQIEVAEFEEAVRRLEKTAYAIPAPLNQLTGKITASLHASTDLTFEKGQGEWVIHSDLDSVRQSLRFACDGTTHWERGPKLTHVKLDAQVVLNEAALSLPHFDMTRLPRFFPDPQIVYPETLAKQNSVDFQYTVKLRTSPGNPFFLRSSQFDTEIPLELNLTQTSGAGMTGTLSVVSFPVRFFHRDALVKKAALRFPKEGAAELDAQVELHYTDYDLTLSAFGKLDSPRYTLTSQPQLSEQSALSLLLFGRPLEELSPGQGESLASAQAALTSGAVSALSMYLLASTPIESIAYDPTQGRFLATVRLVEGTSLRVEGVKEGVSSIGIRKRLGRDWVLNTYVEKTNPLEDRRSVSTFLEWSKTY